MQSNTKIIHMRCKKFRIAFKLKKIINQGFLSMFLCLLNLYTIAFIVSLLIEFLRSRELFRNVRLPFWFLLPITLDWFLCIIFCSVCRVKSFKFWLNWLCSWPRFAKESLLFKLFIKFPWVRPDNCWIWLCWAWSIWKLLARDVPLEDELTVNVELLLLVLPFSYMSVMSIQIIFLLMDFFGFNINSGFFFVFLILLFFNPFLVNKILMRFKLE